MPRQQTQESLQQRINGILRGSPPVCAVEESTQETVEALSTLLQRAGEELKAAQERVNRLMRALEKARS